MILFYPVSTRGKIILNVRTVRYNASENFKKKISKRKIGLEVVPGNFMGKLKNNFHGLFRMKRKTSLHFRRKSNSKLCN